MDYYTYILVPPEKKDTVLPLCTIKRRDGGPFTVGKLENLPKFKRGKGYYHVKIDYDPTNPTEVTILEFLDGTVLTQDFTLIYNRGRLTKIRKRHLELFENADEDFMRLIGVFVGLLVFLKIFW